MSNVMLDNAAVDLETQIARYQELSTQKNLIEERISRAEAERPSVKDKIFQRVLTGYERELENLNQDLTPLEKEIDAARSDLQNKVKDIDIQTADLQDKLDELAFRHRVGEFSDSQKAEKQEPIEAEYEELTQRGIEYVQTLEKLEMMETGTTAIAEDPAPTDEDEITIENESALPDVSSVDDSEMSEPAATEPTPAEAVAPASIDEHTAPAAQKEETLEANNEDEAFVNPSDWVDEFSDGEFLCAPASPSVAEGTPEESKSEDKAEMDGPCEVIGYSELDMNTPEEKPDENSPGCSEETAHPLSSLADPSDDADAPQDSATDTTDENVDETESAESDDTGQESSLGFPILSITKGSGSGKRLPLLPMTMTIGRELDNNIELKDQDVARYHARITYHAGEYVIHDLEGSSGTFVNEEKISKHTLSPGDLIRAGETELTFDME